MEPVTVTVAPGIPEVGLRVIDGTAVGAAVKLALAVAAAVVALTVCAPGTEDEGTVNVTPEKAPAEVPVTVAGVVATRAPS